MANDQPGPSDPGPNGAAKSRARGSRGGSGAASPGSSTVGVLSEAAIVAASGCDVEEKVHEILAAAERILPVDGWMVWDVDPLTGARSRLFAKGYPDHLAAYVDSPQFETEVVAPFAEATGGWPARVRDLPCDPRDLRCMSEYYLPLGFVEGMVAPLWSRDGRCAGYLDCSSADLRHPSDEGRVLMATLSQILGRLVDPLEGTARAAAALSDDEFVIGLRAPAGADDLASRRADVLRPARAPSEVTATFDDLLGLVGGSTARWWSTRFLWEDALGAWYRCRALRCRGDAVVVGVSRIEQRPYGLSRRELEVLTLIADGLNNDEIAARIVVTTRTVKAHVEHILEKIGVRSRAAATRVAIDEGLLLRPARRVGAHDSDSASARILLA